MGELNSPPPPISNKNQTYKINKIINKNVLFLMKNTLDKMTNKKYR